MSRIGKRKRNGELSINVAQAKLHQRVKEVKQAAKRAKNFEIQRLLKKHRSSDSTHSPQISSSKMDVGETLRLLREADPDTIGCTALYRKIHKDKTLASNDLLTSALESELPVSIRQRMAGGSSADNDAENRLLSSKHLSTEVNQAIESLKRLLSPQDPTSQYSSPSLTNHHRATQPDDASLVFEEPDEPEPTPFHQQNDGDSDRLSSDSSPAGTTSGLSSPSPSDHSLPTKRLKIPNSEIDSSKFLPSLSVGFTRGDTDESEMSAEDAADQGSRRNRRGQRARKAIWEKKYGKNANHIRKQKEVDEAVRANREAWARGGARGRRWGEEGAPKAKTDAARNAKVAEERPIHGSWEAKKRLKDKEKEAIMARPQGKKIVFDP